MRKIGPYLALLTKDFKMIFGISFALLVLTAAARSFSVIRQDMLLLVGTFPLSFDPGLQWFSPGIVYMLTAILVYSMNIEYFGGSRYIFFSIPLNRAWFLPGKFIVITIVGFCVYFTEYTIAFLPWDTFTKALLIHIYGYPETSFQNYDLNQWFPLVSHEHGSNFFIFYSNIFLMFFRWTLLHLNELICSAGLACLAQGIICTVKRYRFILWSVIYASGIVALGNFRSLMHANEITPFIYYSSTYIAGFVFLVIGLILFKKYSEV
jgi:hypothetical protein